MIVVTVCLAPFQMENNVTRLNICLFFQFKIITSSSETSEMLQQLDTPWLISLFLHSPLSQCISFYNTHYFSKHVSIKLSISLCFFSLTTVAALLYFAPCFRSLSPFVPKCCKTFPFPQPRPYISQVLLRLLYHLHRLLATGPSFSFSFQSLPFIDASHFIFMYLCSPVGLNDSANKGCFFTAPNSKSKEQQGTQLKSHPSFFIGTGICYPQFPLSAILVPPQSSFSDKSLLMCSYRAGRKRTVSLHSLGAPLREGNFLVHCWSLIYLLSHSFLPDVCSASIFIQYHQGNTPSRCRESPPLHEERFNTPWHVLD